MSDPTSAHGHAGQDAATGTRVPGGPPRAPRPSGAAMRFDDAESTTVLLVRHGETALTQGKAMSGSSVPGPGLAPSGRVQVAKAADLVFRVGRAVWPDLHHPSALHASPMVRTQESAAAVGRRLGLPVTTDEAFAEADFGRWEGLTVAQIEERWPGHLRRWYEDATVAAPDGESLRDVGARVEVGLERLLAGGVGRSVVVVSHAMAIRAAVGVTLGVPAARWAWLRILPASVTVLRWWADGSREAVVVGMPTDL